MANTYCSESSFSFITFGTPLTALGKLKILSNVVVTIIQFTYILESDGISSFSSNLASQVEMHAKSN
jgi:hypothetical protein